MQPLIKGIDCTKSTTNHLDLAARAGGRGQLGALLDGEALEASGLVKENSGVADDQQLQEDATLCEQASEGLEEGALKSGHVGKAQGRAS